MIITANQLKVGTKLDGSESVLKRINHLLGCFLDYETLKVKKKYKYTVFIYLAPYELIITYS